MDTPSELDKHITRIPQYLEGLMAACKAKEGWVETGTKKSVYIDHKTVAGGRFAMRGTGDMPNTSVQDIWDLIMSFSTWKEWDEVGRIAGFVFF